MNVLGRGLLFSPYRNNELRLPSLSVDNSDHFLAVQLANVQVPDSLTVKISKTCSVKIKPYENMKNTFGARLNPPECSIT